MSKVNKTNSLRNFLQQPEVLEGASSAVSRPDLVRTMLRGGDNPWGTGCPNRGGLLELGEWAALLVYSSSLGVISCRGFAFVLNLNLHLYCV